MHFKLWYWHPPAGSISRIRLENASLDFQVLLQSWSRARILSHDVTRWIINTDKRHLLACWSRYFPESVLDGYIGVGYSLFYYLLLFTSSEQNSVIYNYYYCRQHAISSAIIYKSNVLLVTVQHEQKDVSLTMCLTVRMHRRSWLSRHWRRCQHFVLFTYRNSNNMACKIWQIILPIGG